MEVVKDNHNECSNNNNTNAFNAELTAPRVLELTLLSPSSPDPPPDDQPHGCSETQGALSTSQALFAQKLQMKLKSHLETSTSSDSSSSDEFFTNSNSSGGGEEDSTNSSSEIFYDFDEEIISYDEVITSDYGTGGSNSTVVASSRSSSSSSSSGSSTSGSGSIGVNSRSSGAGESDQGQQSNEAERSSTAVVVVHECTPPPSPPPPRYQRSSSLKTGKTPPGTPIKKIVRFADAMGLDLTDIKVFLDEIPRVPKEAYRDLHIPDFGGGGGGGTCSSSTNSSTSSFSSLLHTNDLSKGAQFFTQRGGSTTLLNFVPLFHQPVTMPDFFDRIRDKKVLLENAYLTQETVTSNNAVECKQVIKGTVRVMNLDFHKSVYIRYTYNDWKEFTDFQATYMPGSCDGFSDRFEFRIDVDESRLPPPYVSAHDDAKIAFACRFHCQGKQFWDNNQDRNYVFQNVPTSHAPRSPVTSPAFLIDDADDDFSSKPNKTPQPPPPPYFINPPSSLPRVDPVPTPTVIIADEKVPEPSSAGGGGGSHVSSTLYTPASLSFYDHAYGSYSQFGSACFY